jgi:hypothetical protein
MPDNHIHLPPMPKPEDFGITKDTWSGIACGNAQAKAMLDAYNRAVDAWTRAVSGLNE